MQKWMIGLLVDFVKDHIDIGSRFDWEKRACKRGVLHALVIVMLILSAVAIPVSARTIYVDGSNGNDSNGGLTEGAAKQSIGAGLSIAVGGDEDDGSTRSIL